ncbi:MAG: hypothetical protein N2V75_13115 [Methanophagales archaeon]|nr:hypothetical protein [Methanophagales archaeon]
MHTVSGYEALCTCEGEGAVNNEGLEKIYNSRANNEHSRDFGRAIEETIQPGLYQLLLETALCALGTAKPKVLSHKEGYFRCSGLLQGVKNLVIE